MDVARIKFASSRAVYTTGTLIVIVKRLDINAENGELSKTVKSNLENS